MGTPLAANEHDLDPSTTEEWSAFERAALRLLGRVVERHRSLREGPCFREPPQHDLRAVEQQPPPGGLGLEAALTRALSSIDPSAPAVRPRFRAGCSGGTLAGMLRRWLAST